MVAVASWSTRLMNMLTGSAKPTVQCHCTQYTKATEDSEKIQLVVGIDFGTAYTKVVIGERRRAYAVPFDGISCTDNPYLLPSRLAVGERGQVQLGTHEGWQTFSDLKMRILNNDTGDQTLSLAVSFLALAIQRARYWFLNTHRQTYERYQLDWNVNVGLPTEHYHDLQLKDFYCQIVKAAWHASTKNVQLDLDMVCGSFTDEEGTLTEGSLGLFPEFVAQINGYVRSPMRRHDAHLLVDVGAGTVDVAVFNVHERDGDDVFPIFVGSVKPCGVQFLHKHRVDSVNLADVDHVANYAEDASDVEAARSLGVTIDDLRRIDDPFSMRVLEQIKNAVDLAKCKYPTSRHWTTGVPFFLCGGGARAELYAVLANRMERDSTPCPLIRLELPQPDRLVAEGIDEAAYDRLSVAYGLSFDQFDIGEIVPSDQIEDWKDEPEHGIECPACYGTGGQMANNCNRCGGSGWLP